LEELRCVKSAGSGFGNDPDPADIDLRCRAEHQGVGDAYYAVLGGGEAQAVEGFDDAGDDTGIGEIAGALGSSGYCAAAVDQEAHFENGAVATALYACAKWCEIVTTGTPAGKSRGPRNHVFPLENMEKFAF